ncbi:MAG: peptidylprolyl isomerase [Firmicutes bacterium]|nr:peptidylprolyl isomerase [Bacillota bacterium]
MRTRKALSAILAAALILTSCTVLFSSCAGTEPALIEYDDVKITAPMYMYYLSHYKAVFLSVYSEVSDTDAFWDSMTEDGITYEEYFTEVIIENLKKTVVAAWLFDYMGLTFTSSMKEEVEDGIDELCYYLCGGDKDAFDEYLSDYGIDADTLYDIYVIDAKISYAYQYLYGASGILDVSDEEALAYAQENYALIGHLYVNNKFKYETDSDGNYLYDEETGEYYRFDLSDDELAEKEEIIAAVKEGLDEGTSFEELWNLYSEDQLYEGGYYIYEGMENFIDEVVEAALEMEIGDIICIETEYGTHFLKRYEITGTPWEDDENADFFEDFEDNLADYVFTNLMNDYSEDVTVYKELLSQYSLQDASPGYDI